MPSKPNNNKQASLDLADIESETLINVIATCSQISLQMNRILDQINKYHFKCVNLISKSFYGQIKDFKIFTCFMPKFNNK